MGRTREAVKAVDTVARGCNHRLEDFKRLRTARNVAEIDESDQVSTTEAARRCLVERVRVPHHSKQARTQASHQVLNYSGRAVRRVFENPTTSSEIEDVDDVANV